MICAGHDRGQLEFKTLLAKGGDVVGIFAQSVRRRCLQFMISRRMPPGPGLLSRDIQTDFKLSATLHLKDLQAEHQNRQLTLADGVPVSELIKGNEHSLRIRPS